MKPAAAILMIVFTATLWGQQQPGAAVGRMKPIEPRKRQLQIGEIDPKRQCAWISKDSQEFDALEKACEAAIRGFDTLPNFVCDMKMVRRQPFKRPEDITAQLRFVDGEEDFSDLKINGLATTVSQLELGVLSRGEFSPPGLTVLDGASSPKFTFRGEERSRTGSFLAFDYRVDRERNQTWIWSIPPYQYKPAFHGVLWIDTKTGLLEHVSLVAEGDEIETFVPTRSVHIATDYALVKIGDLGDYPLPVHSAVKSCDRFNRECSEIVRDFVNCRKFAAKARIVE